MKKPVKIIAALAAAIMSLSGLTAVQAAEQKASENKLVLVDCADTARYDGTIFVGATLNENKRYTYGDRAASARFKIRAGKSQTVTFNLDNAADLSAYRTLTIRAYSTQATGNTINLTMYDEDGTGYYRSQLRQNWTGWTDINVAINTAMKFTGFDANKGIADVTAIKQICLNEGGWSNQANILACDMYIDSIFVSDSVTIGEGIGMSRLLGRSQDRTHPGDYTLGNAQLTAAKGQSATIKSGRKDGTDRLADTGISPDISGYKTVNCRVYNEIENASSFLHVGIYTQPDAKGNYHVYDVPLNFTGWKTINVDLDAKPKHTKMNAVTDPNDIQYDPRKHMEGFALNLGGWHENASDVNLYVDAVWFSKDNGSSVIFDGSDSDSISLFGLGTATTGDITVGNFQGTGAALQKYNPDTLIKYGRAQDWTEYDKLTMLVYSLGDSASGDVLEIVPYISGSAYYIYKLPIDWDGWKEVSIPLSDFEKVGNISWNKIDKLVLSYGKYGGSQTSADCSLNFDKIVLQKNGDEPLTGNIKIEKDNMGVYKAKATVLTPARKMPYELILAAKSQDNVFKTAVTNSAVSSGVLRVDLSAEYTPTDNAEIKAMLWDGTSTMKPYQESVVR